MIRIPALLLLATAIVLPTQADAAACLQRDAISKKLAVDHNEHPTALGLASSGDVIEVFASPDGTWTMVLTDSHGVSCVLASGQGWSGKSLPLPGNES